LREPAAGERPLNGAKGEEADEDCPQCPADAVDSEGVRRIIVLEDVLDAAARIRTRSETGKMKIFPSPTSPVRAASTMAATAFSVSSDLQQILNCALGTNPTSILAPR